MCLCVLPWLECEKSCALHAHTVHISVCVCGTPQMLVCHTYYITTAGFTPVFEVSLAQVCPFPAHVASVWSLLVFEKKKTTTKKISPQNVNKSLFKRAFDADAKSKESLFCVFHFDLVEINLQYTVGPVHTVQEQSHEKAVEPCFHLQWGQQRTKVISRVPPQPSEGY